MLVSFLFVLSTALTSTVGNRSQQSLTQCYEQSHALILLVPAGSPSHGGDVAVYVFNISQPSLPTPFYSVLVCFCLYGPLKCISFHIFSRQLSAFSFCSSSLISALLVLSTIYFFVVDSLNGPCGRELRTQKTKVPSG